MENFPSFADYFLALLFGVGVPLLSGIRGAQGMQEAAISLDPAQKRRFYLGNSLFLFISGMLVLLVWGGNHRPPEVLGLQWPKMEHGWTVLLLVLAFAGLYLMDILSSLREQDRLPDSKNVWEKQMPFLPGSWSEWPAYGLMCLCAGMFEEIIYRGFLVNFFRFQFNGVPGESLWCVLTPAFLFSMAHYYQGITAVLKILVLSLIFGILFLQTESLLIIGLLHFLLDVISGITGMYLLRKGRKSA